MPKRLKDGNVTPAQLMAVMKYHLSSFDDEQVPINNDTIHDTVLSDSDGLTPQVSSKRLYKGLMVWTIDQSGMTVKDWPSNWMTLSVAELANKLI